MSWAGRPGCRRADTSSLRRKHSQGEGLGWEGRDWGREAELGIQGASVMSDGSRAEESQGWVVLPNPLLSVAPASWKGAQPMLQMCHSYLQEWQQDVLSCL